MPKIHFFIKNILFTCETNRLNSFLVDNDCTPVFCVSPRSNASPCLNLEIFVLTLFPKLRSYKCCLNLYTQQDLDNFEVVDGVKQCPSGDYSLISEFKERCSFAAGCRFAKGCNIEGHTLKHSYVISVSGIGEYKRTLYLWITYDGIFCQAGCFFGSEEEFMIAVRNKYGENSAYEQSLNLLKGINNVT